jgi:hypothetical protein
MPTSAHTIGRDHVDGPLGMLGGRPRPGGGGGVWGWRLTAHMVGAGSHNEALGIRVLPGTCG